MARVKCKNCEKEFIQRIGSQKYCSDKCYKEGSKKLAKERNKKNKAVKSSN